MKIETNKHRLFFYGTLIPVLIMFGLMYVEYDRSKQIVFTTHARTNRQIELLSICNQSKIDDQAMRHMAITYNLQKHHAEEIDQLVIFYTEMLDDIKAGEEN